MTVQVPTLTQMPGMWRRSLIIQPDGTRDTTTQVRWLQAQSVYVDLRQDAALPDFLHLRCLNDITPDDCEPLARQEGFAGRLAFDGDCFEWHRVIDFQPRAQIADAGRLHWEEDTLIESGRDVDYVEHWQRDPTVVTRPLAALRLRDTESGRAAIAVQLGTVFMFARDRGVQLPALRSLVECIRGADSLAQARAWLDCEISLGSVGFGDAAGPGGASVILASTLPWRVSRNFQLHCSHHTALSADSDADGRQITRRWEIVAAEGNPESVWPASRTDLAASR